MPIKRMSIIGRLVEQAIRQQPPLLAAPVVRQNQTGPVIIVVHVAPHNLQRGAVCQKRLVVHLPVVDMVRPIAVVMVVVVVEEPWCRDGPEVDFKGALVHDQSVAAARSSFL